MEFQDRDKDPHLFIIPHMSIPQRIADHELPARTFLVLTSPPITTAPSTNYAEL